MLGGFLDFKTIVGFGSLNILELDNYQFKFFQKFQNKTFKESMVFMKELEIFWWFFGMFFDFLEKMKTIYKKWLLEKIGN